MISRFFDFSSKPGSCPESPDSRIIPARREIFSRKGGGGGLSDSASRRKSGRADYSEDCFWGRCPGCNPPSVLSSICLIGEPAPPAEDQRRLLPLSHRCRDPFHPPFPALHQSSPGEGRSSSSRPGKVSFLRPRTGSHLAPLTATTVSAMWVEFPQDHDHGPVTAHRLAAYPNDTTRKCCAESF